MLQIPIAFSFKTTFAFIAKKFVLVFLQKNNLPTQIFCRQKKKKKFAALK